MPISTRRSSPLPLVLLALPLLPVVSAAQTLPILHPMNPVAESRSGLYFQPLVPRQPGWRFALGLDYASMVELNFGQSFADTAYLLDAEVLRLNLGASRDLSPRTFVLGELALGGSYNGFLDGFLDWYHGLFGIHMPEREGRPKNRYAYRYRFPSGRTVGFARHGAYLGDVRLGVGLRHSDRGQSVLSVTLPTNTAGAGFGRGTVSVSLLNTYRVQPTPRFVYEGSVNAGVTPRHGSLSSVEKSAFVMATSGFRWRTIGRVWSFANLYLHSPYYGGTGAAQLDRSELTIDFGWIIRSRGGHEFRFGMTEDLWPSGPAIDADFRVGYAW
jgi:hypothetical protein